MIRIVLAGLLAVMSSAALCASASSSASSRTVDKWVVPAGYTTCAARGETCSFSGTRTVLMRTCNYETLCFEGRRDATGSLLCMPSEFNGSVSPNDEGRCYVSDQVTGLPSSSSSSRSSAMADPFLPPAGFKYCSERGETCKVTGTRVVMFKRCFETLCSSARKPVVSTVLCADEEFGLSMPAPSTRGVCFVQIDPVLPLSKVSGKASASGQSGNSRQAAMAIDDDVATRWEASNSAAGAWIQMSSAGPFRLGRVDIAEYGSRIRSFRLEYLQGSTWVPFLEGGTLGTRSVATPIVITTAVRLITTSKSAGQPSISSFTVLGGPLY